MLNHHNFFIVHLYLLLNNYYLLLRWKKTHVLICLFGVFCSKKDTVESIDFNLTVVTDYRLEARQKSLTLMPGPRKHLHFLHCLFVYHIKRND